MERIFCRTYFTLGPHSLNNPWLKKGSVIYSTASMERKVWSVLTACFVFVFQGLFLLCVKFEFQVHRKYLPETPVIFSQFEA